MKVFLLIRNEYIKHESNYDCVVGVFATPEAAEKAKLETIAEDKTNPRLKYYDVNYYVDEREVKE